MPHPGPGQPPGHGGPDGTRPTAMSLAGGILLECASRGLSGAVTVTGEPGGTIHLRQGGVVAVDSPGAPGPEVLLLRSGQIAESAWTATFAAATADGQLGDELVRRGLIGAARLEVVLRTALADGMFVVAAGLVRDCRVEETGPDCPLPLPAAVDPHWLLAETRRRLAALAALESQIIHDRDQVTVRSWPADQRFGADDGQRDIMGLANGRRTARDMAFILGRGVFAVTLEFDRMHRAGLLAKGPRRGEAPAGPRPADAGPLVARAGATAAAVPADPDGTEPRQLPRRRAPGQPGSAPPASTQPSSSALLRVLRRGFSGPQAGDEST